MAACKCRYCQVNLMTSDAYKIEENKKKAYFCNEEHYKMYSDMEKEKEEKKRQEQEYKRKLAEQKREYQKQVAAQEREERKRLSEQKKAEQALEDQVAKEKRKADKDKAYWLICDIIGRKEIINTALWKEWAIWNKVATNEVIGQYLEENKAYLIDTISKINNIEFQRIKYLSAVLKNELGDYHPTVTTTQIMKSQVVAEETEDVGLRINKKKKATRRKGFSETEG